MSRMIEYRSLQTRELAAKYRTVKRGKCAASLRRIISKTSDDGYLQFFNAGSNTLSNGP
jgi:hypothetical protein